MAISSLTKFLSSFFFNSWMKARHFLGHVLLPISVNVLCVSLLTFIWVNGLRHRLFSELFLRKIFNDVFLVKGWEAKKIAFVWFTGNRRTRNRNQESRTEGISYSQLVFLLIHIKVKYWMNCDCSMRTNWKMFCRGRGWFVATDLIKHTGQSVWCCCCRRAD